ncbi:MAG: AMP-binding protein, partial [bacterium]|nr:AMP-binding protein [bacterium]
QTNAIEIESVINKLKYGTTDEVNEEDSIAFIIFTSGTVGDPKGVMLTHKNFHINVLQCIDSLKVDRSFNFMCLLPMFHSFAWTTCVLVPIYVGSKILIVESVLDFKKHIKDIYKYRITAIVGVPPIFHALSKVKGIKKFILKFLFRHLKFCISGAAKLPIEVLEEFEKKFKIPLLEGYGLTEASPVVSVNRLNNRKKGSVGIALKGIEIKILDENENPVEEGEICIKGENVFKGYYLNEEETKKAFTKDGFLKTGDIGKIVDGFLYILDRKKDIIIVKGINVYPNEIEAVALSVKGVEEAAAIGIPDERGDEKIVLYIKGKDIDLNKLKEILKKDLASYKIPKEIIKIDEMPKNAMQKILKRELRNIYAKSK